MRLFGRDFRLFHPILAGATLWNRLFASFGALVCIFLCSAVCAFSPFIPRDLPILIAPLGASAVLLFAVPASPLAQPWSLVGGNVISAIIGVMVFQGLGHGALAVGVAVGFAILAMSLLRCLHPPGGAVAMTAVMGGPAVWHAGLAFAFGPVALNSLVVLILSWLFHRISGHTYPHRARADPAAEPSHHLHRSDIQRALNDAGEAFDVSEDDLEMLLERAEHYSRLRTQVGAQQAGRRPHGSRSA